MTARRTIGILSLLLVHRCVCSTKTVHFRHEHTRNRDGQDQTHEGSKRASSKGGTDSNRCTTTWLLVCGRQRSNRGWPFNPDPGVTETLPGFRYYLDVDQ